MNTLKFFSIAFLSATAFVQAQDLDQVKKAVDAEQYEKAKTMLKTLLQTKPDNGRAAFLLGNIYLKQNSEDSAKVVFQKGLSAPDGGRLNNIGLGQLDLESDNTAAAQAKFDLVMKDMKKKDTEEYICIAQAYMNVPKPDYKKAIALLEKAKLINPNDAMIKLVLGDAYYGDKSQNEAYASYRDAYTTDNTLIRAKMQLGVLLKGAKAYTEAIAAYNEVIALNANYGPVYRELAETYYLWAYNKPSTFKENIAKALDYYNKYMSLTDYSLASRMRHADFLILAKDYKALEAEANEMKKLDKVNPRILRYLGYAAYENGNTDAAITALTDYIQKGSKIISGDYYYLGLSKIKKAVAADGKTVDATILANGISDIKKSLELDPTIANLLNEVAKNYYGTKLYNVAAALFEVAITNSNSKNYVEDNMYFGLCVYTVNRGKDAKTIDKVALQNADKAMDTVIQLTPTYPDAFLYKARINNSLENDEIMAKSYQQFLDVLNTKTPEEIAKAKTKMTEAYNNMAAHYANSDKAKAKELLNKTLALDPTNTYALDSLKILK
ncbi:tetratricopeptide repeat protein [Flavobacterium aciduliphilum]|uniref:Tetratricopeptide repeat protein n=1 Tax=Flavobacterium aciduliphilum TaxID=1101402 RepID=A0A328YJT7_9FLAO|nr:tetratricopeptide repeat protein [Flavobacterium aciduliphilum]RAR74189.1 tetratricopeptide repeat protein [Flavobacterium aciduliphilum]